MIPRLTSLHLTNLPKMTNTQKILARSAGGRISHLRLVVVVGQVRKDLPDPSVLLGIAS